MNPASLSLQFYPKVARKSEAWRECKGPVPQKSYLWPDPSVNIERWLPLLRALSERPDLSKSFGQIKSFVTLQLYHKQGDRACGVSLSWQCIEKGLCHTTSTAFRFEQSDYNYNLWLLAAVPVLSLVLISGLCLRDIISTISLGLSLLKTPFWCCSKSSIFHKFRFAYWNCPHENSPFV